MTSSIEKRVDYYRNKDVRARIVEFLGGDGQKEPTCCYLAGGDMDQPQLDLHRGIHALGGLFDAGSEICRSLWDETSLLADFDIEHVNFDHPADSFLDPERIFEIQEPVADIIERTVNDVRDFSVASPKWPRPSLYLAYPARFGSVQSSQRTRARSGKLVGVQGANFNRLKKKVFRWNWPALLPVLGW